MSTLESPIQDGSRDPSTETLQQAALDATFTGFFHREQPAVLRFLKRLEADRGMVEDACQEAFVATRAKWADVKDYQKLPDRQIANLLGIAHNTVREYKVEARRRLQQMAESDGFSTPAGRRRR